MKSLSLACIIAASAYAINVNNLTA